MTLNRRLDTEIFLIGDIDAQILGNQLPSNRQVLKVLFFNLRELKLTLQESAVIVIKEATVFWDKARLPTQRPNRCEQKLKLLYEKWRSVDKNKLRGLLNLKHENDFTTELDNLFDISHGNILEKIDEKGKCFLLNQRRDGRVGYIGDIETIYDVAEASRKRKAETISRRLEKNEMEKQLLDEFAELASSDESSLPTLSQRSIGTYSNVSIDNLDQSDIFIAESEDGPSAPKKSRGCTNIFNEKLIAVLDRCKLSDRDALHVIAAVGQALQQDISSLNVNRTSLRRYRQRLRARKAENIKNVFKKTALNAVVLHWDGKMLPNMMRREVTDRLPIVITNGKIEQLLGVPELENGTGASQANAIYDVLDDWGLSHTIKALCCDTTASNLGHMNGAAVILERILQRDILYLPCRHHIFEIILRSVFEQKVPGTRGPAVTLFKRFQDSWRHIDKTSYQSGVQNDYVREKLSDCIKSIICFVSKTLVVNQPRDDYQELLELALIFLGIDPPRGVIFRYPGPNHHARFMSKAIYCLKIYLFREQFKLSVKEEKAIRDVSMFIVAIYVRAWFTAPSAPEAPDHDLQLLKKLDDYKGIDFDISQVTVRKLINHLWYLNPESAAMSFFDQEVSLSVKRKMLTALNDNENEEETFKRIQINHKDIDNIHSKEMDYFITPQSRKFFERFNISQDFLKLDPSMWSEDANFNEGLNIVINLKVVNDTAERAVRLTTDYNNILTRNDEQKQFILQVVSEYRKNYPDSNKRTIINKQ